MIETRKLWESLGQAIEQAAKSLRELARAANEVAKRLQAMDDNLPSTDYGNGRD